jgi:hypothetical protein
MATTTTIIDMNKVCNSAHNIINQLVKLGNKFFAVNTGSSPLLPAVAAPRSDHATSSVTASLPCSGLATKLIDNDAHLSNSERAQSKEDVDIYNMTNRWKMMFDELFTRPDNSPPIVGPPQPEIPTYTRVGAAIFLKPYQQSSKVAVRRRVAWRRGKRCHTSNGGSRRKSRPARYGLPRHQEGGATSGGTTSRRAADFQIFGRIKNKIKV